MSSALDIVGHFYSIEDPRLTRNRLHSLEEIFLVTICGVICGEDTWVGIEEFAIDEESWFRTLLPFEHGIPSHDTLGRVFGLLDADEVSACFVEWMNSVVSSMDGEVQVVAIDGKTLRRSFSKSRKAIHMLSAHAAGFGLVLGQQKTAEKSNEITAIPKLLEKLHLAGCIVTTDAMGCQTKIAKFIVDKGADYTLQVKGNQGTLHEDIKELDSFFEDAPNFHEETDGDHGRIEVRRTQSLPVLEGLEHLNKKWTGLQSLVRVQRRQEQEETCSIETRYFISSLEPENTKLIAHSVRRHWSIENEVHWILDVAFREDENRTRIGNAAENLALIRHVALNLLKSEKTAKVGINIKRKKAGRNRKYRETVLNSLEV